MQAAALLPDRSHRWFVGLVLTVFAAMSIQYSIKVMTPARDGLTKSAILRWSKQLQAMEDGENIHKTYNYPNPPIMALMLWPVSELAEVNPLVGALAWFYFKVGLVFVCLYWTIRLLVPNGQAFPAWAIALGFLLSLRPILGDLSHGNVNIFIMFLVFGGLYCFHRGYDIAAGLLIALAIACKVTPALFVGYFVWKRAWRVLGGTALGLVAFFLLVPAVFLGWDQNLQSLWSWVEGMVLPYLVGGQVTTEHQNQSLPGVLYRLMTESPSFSVFVNDAYVPTEYHNVANIAPATAKWLVKGVMFGFVLLVIWLCRNPVRSGNSPAEPARDNWLLAAEYSLVLVGMLMFSERTWKHHCVVLLLPYCVLSYALTRREISGISRKLVIGSMLLSLLLISTTSTGFGIDRAGKLAQVYGAYLWAFGVLIGGLCVVLKRGAGTVAPQAGQSG